MDSKLRKRAILASMAVILLVSILVVYTNQEQNTDNRYQTQQTMQNSASEQVQNEGGDSFAGAAISNAEQTVVNGQIGNNLSAFLNDNTFFDEEINPVLESAKDQANRLSLITTSVEKDLRIQIVDQDGVPVE